MPKLYDRRDFLQVAASMLAAPALLSNQSAIAALQKKPAALTMPPTLEVLYDTLGNATDGWGWVGQGSYTSTVANGLGLNYIVVTDYIGTLSTSKRLRGFDFAYGGYNRRTEQNVPPSNFLGHMWLGIWRSDVGTFFQQPVAVGGLGSGSLATINLGIPTTGNYTTPAGFLDGTYPIYVFGWDNLDVLLPTNVELEISLQFEEAAALGDIGGKLGSSPWINQQRSASSSRPDGGIAQPMATRITVSDLAPTAASADIFGRVVNKSGRGINGVRVTLLDTQNNRTTSTGSNPFGYFRFTGLPTGVSYILSATSKTYKFSQSIRTFQLLEDVTDLRIVAD